jgi:hypothetical protein
MDRICQRDIRDVHSPIAPISPASWAKLESYASGFARTRTSIPCSPGSSVHLTSSRRRRFTRFRSTILCLCFGTTTPTRGCNNREADARASRRSVCMRFPVRLTASRSASLVSRCLRGNPSVLGAGVFCRQLDGKPFTSLLSTPAENFTPPFSSHPQPETMRADTALVAGTVGGLAHYNAPETKKNEYSTEPVKLFQH